MVIYQCPKCEKIYYKKSEFDRHLARKTPCVLSNSYKRIDFTCKGCGKNYSRKDPLFRHGKVCKHTLKENNTNINSDDSSKIIGNDNTGINGNNNNNKTYNNNNNKTYNINLVFLNKDKDFIKTHKIKIPSCMKNK